MGLIASPNNSKDSFFSSPQLNKIATVVVVVLGVLQPFACFYTSRRQFKYLAHILSVVHVNGNWPVKKRG